MRIARTQHVVTVAALVLAAAAAGCGNAEQNDAAADSAVEMADSTSPAGFGPSTDTAAALQVDTPSTGTPTDSAAPRDTTRDTTARR